MRVYIFNASAVPRTDYPGYEGIIHVPSFKFPVNANHLRDAYRFALDKSIALMEERGYVLNKLYFVGCHFNGEAMTYARDYEDKIIELQKKA